MPIAYNATKREISFIGIKNGPDFATWCAKRNRLAFYVPEGHRFEVMFAAAGSETIGAALLDPTGVDVWRVSTVDGVERLQPEPKSGLWTIEFGKPAIGAYEDHAIGLHGVPGWLFLSKDRYWRYP